MLWYYSVSLTNMCDSVYIDDLPVKEKRSHSNHGHKHKDKQSGAKDAHAKTITSTDTCIQADRVMCNGCSVCLTCLNTSKWISVSRWFCLFLFFQSRQLKSQSNTPLLLFSFTPAHCRPLSCQLFFPLSLHLFHPLALTLRHLSHLILLLAGGSLRA